MLSLFKIYVSKVEGVVNPPYSAKLLDLLLTIFPSGDKKVS